MKKSKCKVCGVELPVFAWKRCMLHDATSKKIVKKPFIELRGHRTRPFTSYLGYDIRIDFIDFLEAKELVVDNWAIIGWR